MPAYILNGKHISKYKASIVTCLQTTVTGDLEEREAAPTNKTSWNGGDATSVFPLQFESIPCGSYKALFQRTRWHLRK